MEIVKEIKNRIAKERKKERDFTKIKTSSISPFGKGSTLHEPDLLNYYRTILGEIERRLKRKKLPNGSAPSENDAAFGTIKWYYNSLLNENSPKSIEEIVKLRKDGFWAICTNEIMCEREVELHMLQLINKKEHENKTFKDNPNKQSIILKEFCETFVPHSANNVIAKTIAEKIFKNYQT